MVGMPLAIRLKTADVATTFWFCFVPILAFYYPLMAYGVDRARASGRAAVHGLARQCRLPCHRRLADPPRVSVLVEWQSCRVAKLQSRNGNGVRLFHPSSFCSAGGHRKLAGPALQSRTSFTDC